MKAENDKEQNVPAGGEDMKVDKEFGLTTLSVKNRTTVFFLTFLVVVMGIVTYNTLPKENFPEIEQPIVYVGTPHPGNSPVDMENLITRPIEKEINTIAEVDEIKSTSVQDYSTIIVEFNPETDVDDALIKVKDAVDRAKPELPNDLMDDPNVFEMNFSEMPILNINLSGNYSIETLNDYAEYLEEEIEKLTEISKVEVRGVDEKEVQILADPYAMESRMVSFSDIENAVSAENVTMSGGNILTDGVRRTLRVIGEFTDPSQLEEIVVKNENDNIIYLKDVARIKFGYEDKENYARLETDPVVMVDVVKRSGENLLIATEKIFEIIEEAKENHFPEGLVVTITNDQSENTRDMVSSLENNIISGVILVVLVLLFFLGTRNALFVGIAIPLSMFLTFLILGAFGVTINMMVLFSLIMALGMLVDNGIVVVENVYRLMEKGYNPFMATRLGVGEVAMPVIASTATTLAAFLPLAFWPGMMGEFMKYLPITLIITLGSSLFVALVINPVFISTFMKVDERGKRRGKNMWKYVIIAALIGAVFIIAGFVVDLGVLVVLGNLAVFGALLVILNVYVFTPLSHRFQDSFLPAIEKRYRRLITFALRGRNPIFFFFGTVATLFLAILLMVAFPPPVKYFPETPPLYVNVFIEFPVGTDIEETNSFTKDVEARVLEIVEPYRFMIESVVAKVGQDTSDPNDPSAFGQQDTPNKARLTVNFVEFKERNGQSSKDVMEEIREGLQGYPGVTITVDKDASGPPAGKPVSIELTGEDYATLINTAERMRTFITNSGIAGIEKLKMDLETGKPELIIDVDREKARRFGLSTYTVANEVRTSLFGKEISKYKEGEDDYEIQLRLDTAYRYDLDALLNKSITFRNQSSGQLHQVPISSVADVELSSTYGSVKRKELKRVITLSSNVLGDYNATEVNDQIKTLLDDFNMPAGYEYKFGGEQEKQAEEMAFLSQALLLAVFFIFLIIVSQFNKITAPFIIMTSVLFSTIGVFLGLVIFRMEFIVIMTMIGIISLAGIVVNNAIVLIDFIELQRKRHREETGTELLSFDLIKESIIEAGEVRLRPVLLTAITTILGLIPLAVGINIDFGRFFTEYNPDFYLGGDNVAFWGPMSWTIIFGLAVSTFLTLVIVPVMYLLADKIKYKASKRKDKLKDKMATA
ncbi:MAG: efflux RND transporter permease subunit [Cyclobacteriaceae bacterium]